MLTVGQQKYLNSLSDERIAKIYPFDIKCLETGLEIENILKNNLENVEIYYIGSSVLQIAGENDIDISVVSKNFKNDFEKMKSVFGDPKEIKNEREYVKWEFEKNGFQVELYLNGKMGDILNEQIKTHGILEKDEKLKKEYEKIKLEFDNKLWKEYMKTKMEFFNKVLEIQKPTIYLLCGLPGSGKSFWSKQNENSETIRISHDEEFFKKYGGDWDRKKHNELSEILKVELIEKIKKLIKDNKKVILDYGFWKKSDREEYKKLFESLANVKLIYFDVPKSERFKRVLGRDKKDNHDLNEEALEIFEKKFEIPDIEELEN